METPIQKAINYIQSNMDDIGKEKMRNVTNYECFRKTKQYLKTLLPIEENHIKDAYYRGRVDHPESLPSTFYNLKYGSK